VKKLRSKKAKTIPKGDVASTEAFNMADAQVPSSISFVSHDKKFTGQGLTSVASLAINFLDPKERNAVRKTPNSKKSQQLLEVSVLAALNLLKVSQHLINQEREKRRPEETQSAKENFGKLGEGRRLLIPPEPEKLVDQPWKKALAVLMPKRSFKNRLARLALVLQHYRTDCPATIEFLKKKHPKLSVADIFDNLLRNSDPKTTDIIRVPEFEVLHSLVSDSPDLRLRKKKSS
jgi:hypothetical protein